MSNEENDAWAELTGFRFVAVTIDPVASVKYLRDAQATKEASILKSQTYLGFINGPRPWRGKRCRFAKAESLVAGIGPSLYSEAHKSDPTKCIPIMPNAGSVLGRAPITITGDPLPFQDCYLHTICSQYIGVTHINWNNPTRSFAHFAESPLPELDEYDHLVTMVSEYLNWLILLAEQAAAYNSGLSLKPSLGSERLEENVLVPQRPPSLHSTNDYPMADDAASISSLAPSEDSDTRKYGTHPIEAFSTTTFLPLVHVTYDLSTMITPAPPLGFVGEHAAITDIIRRAGKRFKAL